MIKINNLVTVVFVLILSFLLAYVSFTGGNSEAYLFPKVISFTLFILSCLLLITYFFQKNKKIIEINITRLSTYLLLVFFFIFFGEILGFYFSTTLIFLVVSFFYFSEEKNFKILIYNLLISFFFMLSIYVLFSVLLKVQVPRFFLF